MTQMSIYMGRALPGSLVVGFVSDANLALNEVLNAWKGRLHELSHPFLSCVKYSVTHKIARD